MRRGFLAAVSWLVLAVAHSSAQQQQPATLIVTPTTTPELLQVLDNQGRWNTIGAMAGGLFSPVTSSVFPTHAALLGAVASGEVTPVVEQQGYNAAADGGYAEYDWNATSTATADGNAIILPSGQPSGTPGRYILRAQNGLNVLLFGADPTGTNDSTTPIQAAANAQASIGGCVYVPPGSFRVDGGITLQVANGCLRGDGRTLSKIAINSATANLTVAGTIICPNNGGGYGCYIHDIGAYYTQPQTVTSRANIVQFPPTIYAQGSSRFKLKNILSAGGNVCLDARGGGGGIFIDTFECGALTMGAYIDQHYDGDHINNWHSWDFGITGTLLTDVYEDGNTGCFNIGRIDGLWTTNTQCFLANITYTSTAGAATDANDWTNLDLNGSWIQAAGNVLIANYFMTQSPPGAAQQIAVSGGVLSINNADMGSTQNVPEIVVTGGNLYIRNAILACATPSVSCATVTNGGLLDINHSEMAAGTGGGPWTAPYVSQTTPGALRFHDNYTVSPGAGEGTLVLFNNDVGLNYLANNTLNGWAVTLPSTTTSGVYGLSCSGAPTSGFTSQSGIVTHC
jgi:Pectate lyase superfamily protein